MAPLIRSLPLQSPKISIDDFTDMTIRSSLIPSINSLFFHLERTRSNPFVAYRPASPSPPAPSHRETPDEIELRYKAFLANTPANAPVAKSFSFKKIGGEERGHREA